MGNNMNHDLNISGVAKMAGGEFNKVTIDGVGIINGNVTCTNLFCNGVSRIAGNVSAELTSINGASTIRGYLFSRQANINGSCKIKGNLSSEQVKISGTIKVQGDCEAELLSVMGGMAIDGLLNAGEVDIRFHGKCRIKEIGGDKITIKYYEKQLSGFSKMFKPFFQTKLIAETVEGDQIYLEHTKAQTVRGTNIIIGPGCEIEQLEYKDDFQYSGDAKITKYTKV